MARKYFFMEMSIMLLTINFMVVGCASVPESAKSPPVALGLTLDELLRKYVGYWDDKWGGVAMGGAKAGVKTHNYRLDPSRFEEFKAELDAGDEYYQTRRWTENRGTPGAQATCLVEPDGGFVLLFETSNNNILYEYKKNSQAGYTLDESPFVIGPKLHELLGKYMWPVAMWDDGRVLVYFLDPARIEGFKAEIDAGGVYYQISSQPTDSRVWKHKKETHVFCALETGGVSFQLIFNNEDNTNFVYEYKKIS